MSKCYAVVGVVGEWTEERLTPSKTARKINFGGLFGAAKGLREFKEGGVRLVEFGIDYAAGLKIPKSYGGVSGGALWELHVELDEKRAPVKVSKKLAGVAFRESTDGRLITCNGRAAIDSMLKLAAEVWT